MAAPKKVEFVIGARDATRGAFRRVRQGLRGVGRALSSFQTLAAGVFAGLALRGLVRFANGLENVAIQAKSLDLTTEQFQALKFAAEEVGLTGADVATVFQRLSRRQGEVLNGNDNLLKNFLRLNITLKDLQELSPAEIWDKATAAAEKLGKAQGDAALALVFDSEGLKLARLTGAEFENIADMTERARAAGAILGPEQLAAAKAFSQAMRELQLKFAKEIAPDLLKFAQTITKETPTIVAGMVNLTIALREFVRVITAIPRFGAALGEAAFDFTHPTRRESTAGGRLLGPLVDKGIETALTNIQEIRDISRRAEARNGGAQGPGLWGS